MKPHTLDFPPLHCSLDRTLGDYYQDFAPAIQLVESGFHGSVDEHGVALADYGHQGHVPNAIIIAQYAIANLAVLGRGDNTRAQQARVQLDWLVSNQERQGELSGCWVMTFNNPKYPWLRAPWTSALASGNAISALLRGWEVFGDQRYRTAADVGYEALHEARTGLTLGLEGTGDLWYEEYPGNPPLHVLNGHIYALLGVLDYARVTQVPEADSRWRRAAATALRHLDDFDLGYWSAYDLRWREPAALHYQKNIHVPQLRILATLTGDEGFSKYADRWERQFRSVTSRARWHAALRVHGQKQQRLARQARRAAPTVSLRPFPFPFQAGLALCNDADFLTVDRFQRLDRFLRTKAETEWGRGLGLPVAGSFFMYRSPDSPNEFTVFDHLSNTITDDGEFILDCAKRGLLDILHTYGCFTDPRHFTRPLAARALETLAERGITIETWVNHGPPTNIQCIGLREEWQGDLAGTPAYHADLLVDHGVRWFWTSTELVDCFSLDPASDRHFHVARPSLVEPYTLRDGQDVRHFQRYGGLHGQTPVLENLPDQISGANLDELVRTGGYAVVYQHLAVRRIHSGFGTRAYAPVDDEWFAAEELAALRGLAARYDNGEIWVTPTTRLLQYRDAYHELHWHARSEPDRDLIVLSSPTSPRELRDLTFYCERPEATTVYIDAAGTLRAIEEVRMNPTDETGRQSITLFPSYEVPSRD